MFRKCVLLALICLGLMGYAGNVLAQSSKELEQQEAKLSDEIKALSVKLEQIGADSPDAKELRVRLEELKAKLERTRARKARTGREARVEVQKHERELVAVKKEKPDSPQVKETQGKPRAELKEAQAPRRAAPRGRMELRAIELREVPMEHAMELIKPFAGEGAIIVGDPRTNKLFIKTQSQYFGDIERLLDHIDVPPSHRHDELIMREEIQRHEFQQHMRRELGEEREREARREPEEREARRELPPDQPRERENRVLHVTLRHTEEGPQLFFREQPISLDALARELHQFDVPAEWALAIHLGEDIPEELVKQVIDLAKEAGLREVGVAPPRD